MTAAAANSDFIMVTGSVTARPETFDALLTASLAHVAKSRSEDGCLSHEVSRSIDFPLQLMFIERWRDRAALARHFEQPGSRDFVQTVRTLAAQSSGVQIYHATHVDSAPQQRAGVASSL